MNFTCWYFYVYVRSIKIDPLSILFLIERFFTLWLLWNFGYFKFNYGN